MPANFVCKDRLDPHEYWTWFDETGIVHATKIIKDGELTYTCGVVACDTENRSVCTYVRCNMPVTCVMCLGVQ